MTEAQIKTKLAADGRRIRADVQRVCKKSIHDRGTALMTATALVDILVWIARQLTPTEAAARDLVMEFVNHALTHDPFQ